MSIEYGTTHAEDTCLLCFLDNKDVPATWEVVNETDRMPVCCAHAAEYRHPLRVN